MAQRPSIGRDFSMQERGVKVPATGRLVVFDVVQLIWLQISTLVDIEVLHNRSGGQKRGKERHQRQRLPTRILYQSSAFIAFLALSVMEVWPERYTY